MILKGRPAHPSCCSGILPQGMHRDGASFDLKPPGKEAPDQATIFALSSRIPIGLRPYGGNIHNRDNVLAKIIDYTKHDPYG